MKKLKFSSVFVMMILAVMLASSCSRFSAKAASRRVERQMSGPKRSSGKVRERPEVRRAKKSQAKKQAQNKKAYQDFVKQSRQRTFDIQTPDVKERMKQNEADIALREKQKDKKARAANKRARKYR